MKYKEWFQYRNTLASLQQGLDVLRVAIDTLEDELDTLWKVFPVTRDSFDPIEKEVSDE